MFKKLLAVVFAIFMLGGVAKADIFNPLPNVQHKAFLNYVNGTSEASSTLLTNVAAIISYLGVREGEAYNFNQHKWVTTTGATIISYTPWNLSLGVTMLNTDGVVGDIDWNAGAYLPTQNIPIMNLTQYLYIMGGAGAEQKVEADGSSPMKFVSILGAEFKFNF